MSLNHANLDDVEDSNVELNDILHDQPTVNEHNRGFHPWEKNPEFQRAIREVEEKSNVQAK